MPPSGSDQPLDLLEQLSRQLRLLDDLLALGNQQSAAIAQGRMSELMALLAEKQPLLAQLSENAGTLRELSDQLVREHAADDPYRVRCRQQKQLVDQAYAQLLEQEQHAEQQLTTSRDQVAERLAASTGSLQAATAYQRMAPQPGDSGAGGRLDLSSD